MDRALLAQAALENPLIDEVINDMRANVYTEYRLCDGEVDELRAIHAKATALDDLKFTLTSKLQAIANGHE